MKLDLSVLPKGAKKLQCAFSAHGFPLYLVGGAVRDVVRGEPAKDFDLASAATPDEMVAICNEFDFHYIPTGLKHGTLTVMVNSVGYEITTFRTETDHDGRHATVSYTRELSEDLARRDFTANAMAVSLETNELVDLFGGYDDAKNGVVRFVGDANARITEDFLRIFRFFRFNARFGHRASKTMLQVMNQNKHGVASLSGERIWSEMSRILSYDTFAGTMADLRMCGVLDVVGMMLPVDVSMPLPAKKATPAAMMGFMMQDMSATTFDKLVRRLKFSVNEMKLAHFVHTNAGLVSESELKWMVLNGTPKTWVVDLLTVTSSMLLDDFMTWDVPNFPVRGSDLLEAGMVPGKELGNTLHALKRHWFDNGCVKTKDDLMAMVV